MNKSKALSALLEAGEGSEGSAQREIVAQRMATVRETLERVPESVLVQCAKAQVRVRLLGEGERYDQASPELQRLRLDVDAWPAPPAGLFVVAERSVFLRQASPMTIAHELGHAFDCALGGGVYRSGTDAGIREAFAQAKAFVTPYAATGLDEYFAECFRALLGVNNPGRGVWPNVSEALLKRKDPKMHGILSALVAGEQGAE